MLTFQQFLIESTEKVFNIVIKSFKYKDGFKKIQVIMNPLKKSFLELSKEFGVVRGFAANSGNLYIFPEVLHSWAAERIPEAKTAIPLSIFKDGTVMVTDYSNHTGWRGKAEVVPVIESNAGLKRIFPNGVYVRFFDEDENGRWDDKNYVNPLDYKAS